MMVTNISSQVGSHTINNTTVYRFIFDVDGTLTPSRQQIVPKFHDWFLKFIEENYVYLVTGSDYSKTVEQLGKRICESVLEVMFMNKVKISTQPNGLCLKMHING